MAEMIFKYARALIGCILNFLFIICYGNCYAAFRCYFIKEWNLGMKRNYLNGGGNFIACSEPPQGTIHCIMQAIANGWIYRKFWIILQTHCTGGEKWTEIVDDRACLKIYFRHLHSSLSVVFTPNSVNVTCCCLPYLA